MYQVKDAMQASFVSLNPEDRAETAIQALLDHKLSGAPVIDADGRLHGIITEFQLLEVIYDPAIAKLRVRELMTREVLTVEESAMLAVAASLLISHRIRLIPVISGGRVVGIISRGDLLQYFLNSGERLDRLFNNLKKNYPTWFDPRNPGQDDGQVASLHFGEADSAAFPVALQLPVES